MHWSNKIYKLSDETPRNFENLNQIHQNEPDKIIWKFCFEISQIIHTDSFCSDIKHHGTHISNCAVYSEVISV